MKLSNKLYDILKWIGLVLLPAIAYFIGQVGTYMGIQDPDTIVRIINAVATLLGMLLGVSCYNYTKEVDHEEDTR